MQPTENMQGLVLDPEVQQIIPEAHTTDMQASAKESELGDAGATTAKDSSDRLPETVRGAKTTGEAPELAERQAGTAGEANDEATAASARLYRGTVQPDASQDQPGEDADEQGSEISRVKPVSEMLKRLVAALELRRLIRSVAHQSRSLEHGDLVVSGPKLRLLRARLLQQIRRIADAVVSQSLEGDASMQYLPEGWSDQACKLHAAQQDVLIQEAKMSDQEQILNERYDIIDESYVDRTQAVLAAPAVGHWSADAEAFDEEAQRFQECVEAREEEYATLCRRLDVSAALELSLAEELSVSADDALTKADLCRAPIHAARGRDNRSGKSNATAGTMDRAPPVTSDDNTERRRGPGARYEVPRDRCTPSQACGDRRPQPMNPKDDPVPGARPKGSDVPHLQDKLRADKLQELDRAQKAWSQASFEFHETRKTYSSRLQRFRTACEQGELRGSKTVFDGEYYMDRAMANRNLTRAQSAYEYAEREAKAVGALPAGLQTSDFADCSDDGYAESVVAAYVGQTDRAAIDRWRTDERQKEIEDESDWLSEDIDSDPAAKSIAANSSGSQDRYSSGRRRKLLDSWRSEQEEHRLREEERRQARM
ncbi:hypothetical protein LTR36_006526 [Oleoguttula mirabilis]|uniref:Uncharacterized protein n=1 Tax=Oleoguttula mirabilis TaxID=1507867 RepID=A0AAV9JVA5_9PEZI|nr:hypothetical protein LTR36_006526 [Oleoguttula mirabilis]